MRHAFIGAVLFVAAALGAAAPALAQEAYPSRPVKLVVGFPPGGTNDILARLLAAKLQDRLGQPFVVENKPGANAIISAEYVARQAKPDGYTLLVAASGALTINPALYSKLPYDPVRDFTTVALLASFPLIVTIGPATPINSIRELIATAKSESPPLAYGSGSSAFQLAAELLANQAGIRLTHVPYKGSGATVAALMGGEIKFTVVDSPAVAAAIKSGKLKGLAVTTRQRSASFPEIPTVAESGLPEYDVNIWTSLVAPRGTPAAVVQTLQAALGEIMQQPDMRERYATMGLEIGSTDTAALDRTIAADIARWTALARAANIKAE